MASGMYDAVAFGKKSKDDKFEVIYPVPRVRTKYC